jgi:hypothetical protein
MSPPNLKKYAIALIISLLASLPTGLFASSSPILLHIYAVFVAPGTVINLSASGLFFGSPTTTYLITARHVLVDKQTNRLVQPSATVRGQASNQHEEMGFVVELSLDTLRQSDNWKEDQGHDLLVIRIEQESKAVDGVRITHKPMSGPAKIHVASTLRFAGVKIGRTAYLSGYRTELILKDPSYSGLNDPTVREGKILLKNNGQIALDYLAKHGDSGAPVFVFDADLGADSAKLIGIHIGRADCRRKEVTFECAVVTPVDYILELIASL